MTTELATRSNGAMIAAPTENQSIGARHVLTPRTVNEAMEMAKLFHASRMYQVADVAQAFVVLTTGMELGLTASQAFRSIHVIKGKPTLSADLMVGLCKSQSCCKAFQLLESSAERAVYRTQRSGEEPVTMSFTLEQAKAAGLLSNDNWRKFPDAMLRARAASALARAVYPDLLMGMYTDEEAEAIDITARREIAPEPPAPTQQEDIALNPADKAERKRLKEEIVAIVQALPPHLQEQAVSTIKARYRKNIKDLSLGEARECRAELQKAYVDDADYSSGSPAGAANTDDAPGTRPTDESDDPFA